MGKILICFAVFISFFRYSFLYADDIVDYVKKNDIKNVEKLLKKNNEFVNCFFDIDRKTPRTLLAFAAELGLTEIVDLLLQYGADPNLISSRNSAPPLERAIYFGLIRDPENTPWYQNIVHALLLHGACLKAFHEGDIFAAPYSYALFNIIARYPLFETIKIFLQHGANTLEENHSGVLSGPIIFWPDHEYHLWLSKELLKISRERQREVECVLEESEVNVGILGRMIMDENVPVYAKIKALLYLLAYREQFPWKIQDMHMKHYFAQIPFSRLFFTNEKLMGFVLQNECLQLVDSFGQTLQEAMEQCMIPEVIPVIFSKKRMLYCNKDLKALLDINKKPGFGKVMANITKKLFRRKKKKRVKQNFLVEKSLVSVLKKARRAGRRDFVKKFYRIYELCRILSAPSKNVGKTLPPEIAGHIVSYTRPLQEM